jgi:hypothetical protein
VDVLVELSFGFEHVEPSLSGKRDFSHVMKRSIMEVV